MSELKVLSKDEVDVLLNLSRETISDITHVANHSGVHEEAWTGNVNQESLNCITELTIAECEKIITSFLRKKIVIKQKFNSHGKLSEALNNKLEKHVFSVVHLMPTDTYGIMVVDLSLLHQTINLLYGGIINNNEPIMESAGKIGILIAEKFCQLCMEGFKQACAEYSEVACKVVKTISLPNLTSKINLENNFFGLQMNVLFGEIETELSIFIPEKFFENLIPEMPSIKDPVESVLWRGAIESQVVDSYVTVAVATPEINIKIHDLLKLKNGDLIPIEDPTQVFVCLNNLKLFRAQAGQANSKRVIKIMKEI